MINAGVILPPASGMETFNDPKWLNIKIQVNYPSNQNSTDNSVIDDDIVIDGIGNIWKLSNVSSVDSTTFEASFELQNDTPSSSIIPDLGGTTQGSVCTPKNGKLSPWWDASYVSTTVYRSARQFSIEEKETSKEELDQIVENDSLPSDSDSIGDLHTKIQNILNNPPNEKFEILVNNWASSDWSLPSGWSATKINSDTAIQVTHNKGEKPTNFSLTNLGVSPPALIPHTSIRTLQMPDNNTFIVTQCAVSDNFKIVVSF